jgi:FAD/FMN-containing dehydrogenase
MSALAFDRISRAWVPPALDSAAHVPALEGRLLTDESTLHAAAEDFGHIVHGRPLAVLEPRSVDDILRMVSFARENRLKIGPRGQGHSAYGQSQVEAGIMVRMSTLLVPPLFGDGWVEVSAGMTWRQVLRATLERGLRPPVLTDNTGLSVGGTLSMGGIDGGSYRYGAQVDTVLALQVVTGEGRLETCWRSSRSCSTVCWLGWASVRSSCAPGCG